MSLLTNLLVLMLLLAQTTPVFPQSPSISQNSPELPSEYCSRKSNVQYQVKSEYNAILTTISWAPTDMTGKCVLHIAWGDHERHHYQLTIGYPREIREIDLEQMTFTLMDNQVVIGEIDEEIRDILIEASKIVATQKWKAEPDLYPLIYQVAYRLGQVPEPPTPTPTLTPTSTDTPKPTLTLTSTVTPSVTLTPTLVPILTETEVPDPFETYTQTPLVPQVNPTNSPSGMFGLVPEVLLPVVLALILVIILFMKRLTKKSPKT